MRLEMNELESSIHQTWEQRWREKLPVRPFPLSENVVSPVWFVGLMPSSGAEILRLLEPHLASWSTSSVDKLFELLRRKYSFQDAYLTDIVKAGPLKVRPPTQEEIDDFWPFFERELEILRPKLLLTIGRDAEGLLRRRLSGRDPFIEYVTHPSRAYNRRKLGEIESTFERARKVADELGI